MSCRNRAFPGTEVPAAQRSFCSTMRQKPSTVSLPRPTSISVIGLHIGVQFAETGEVGVSVQLFGRLVHLVEIESPPIAAGEGFEKRRFMVDKVVFIGAAEGVEPTVGLGHDGAYVVYGDVGRQYAVEPVGGFTGIFEWRRGVEVCDHEPGIHAGVGAAGSCDGRFVTQQCGQRFFETRLGALQAVGRIFGQLFADCGEAVDRQP